MEIRNPKFKMDTVTNSDPHIAQQHKLVTSSQESLLGVLNASTAFLIWGLSPIYYKILKAIPAFEILMHRIVWSFLFLVLLIWFQGQWHKLKVALTTRRTLMILGSTTVIVAGNWFTFIWAITHDQILQTSLGYYINPLVNVLLGMVFLKERLRFPQIIAVLLAGIGVFYLTAHYGKLPWIALILAFSFGFYGLIRKIAPVGALVGLTVETLLLSLPALGYLFYLDSTGSGTFLRMSPKIDLILMCAALVTAIPLLFFTTGARMLHLSTVGILQYIAPSCTFLLAVFIYNEPFRMVQLWTFVLIWSALIIYSTDSLRFYQLSKRTRLNR
jgi:chloramphenicol-sensitive protein RarD